MQKNKQGFSVIEVLIVVFILAIISFIGYYVWQQRHTKPVNQTTTTTPKTSATVPDAYAGWKTYDNTKYAFSIKYPANWSVKVEANNDNASEDNISLIDAQGGTAVLFSGGQPGAGCSGFNGTKNQDTLKFGTIAYTATEVCADDTFILDVTTNKELRTLITLNSDTYTTGKQALASMTGVTAVSSLK